MTNPTSDQTARRPGGGAIRRTELPGGLRVISEDIPGSEAFAVGFFVAVGSRDEGPTVLGAAHYLEHVLFKGTPTRSAEDISAAFDAVGGDANAYTGKEHTCFYAKVLADDAPLALDVIGDMLTRSLIRSEDVEAEREVIVDEIAMHGDDAMEVAYSLVAERLYGHRLGRDVIGTKESIRAMTRAQVRSFWKRHYQPGAVVVAAAGRVDHDELVARLSGWPGAGHRVGIRPAGPRPRLDPVVTQPKEQEQAACVVAFPGLPHDDERRFAATVLATALGGGMSSRLFLEVRERRGLAYHIDASTHSYRDAGQFTLEWLSSPQRVAEIVDVVGEVLADVVAHGITAAELARVQGQLRGSILLGYDSVDARMMRLGRCELTGDHRSIAEQVAAYQAVGPDDVRAMARELLTRPPVAACVGGTVDRDELARHLARWTFTR